MRAVSHPISISKLAPILFTSFQREILNADSTPYHHGRAPRYEAHAGLHPAPLSSAGEDKEEEEGREDSRESQSQVHLPQPAGQPGRGGLTEWHYWNEMGE